MKKFIFFGIVLVVSLSLFNCGNGTGKTPANPRDAADMYIKAAQSGDVKAVENLSTERYKKRAEKEVRRFKKFSKWTLTKLETETESEGTWHAFHYQCEKTSGGTEEVIVAVLEKDGKYLVGDID
ncbi:MAG: DUF4878 domain-containing protein [Candidatus Aminicenantes bacterium]|nr:DUF4878 domain-containing protein [Candidatus Aminicenantes bacterium]